MIINGRDIARLMLEQVRIDIEKLQYTPSMRVVVVGNNPATEMFVRIKERRAREVGITFVIERFSKDTTTKILCTTLSTCTEDALIMQLPLPQQIDTDTVLSTIPIQKDVDVLSHITYEQFISNKHDALLPPVVVAVREVLKEENFNIFGKRTVVIGKGRLVGEPVSRWLIREGAQVEVITRKQGILKNALLHAELIVSGAGVPHLIKNADIRDGVALIDAGTSESDGAIVGDIDPLCADKSILYTPVPGGIGPITVSALFQNIMKTIKRRFA